VESLVGAARGDGDAFAPLRRGSNTAGPAGDVGNVASFLASLDLDERASPHGNQEYESKNENNSGSHITQQHIHVLSLTQTNL